MFIFHCISSFKLIIDNATVYYGKTCVGQKQKPGSVDLTSVLAGAAPQEQGVPGGHQHVRAARGRALPHQHQVCCTLCIPRLYLLSLSHRYFIYKLIDSASTKFRKSISANFTVIMPTIVSSKYVGNRANTMNLHLYKTKCQNVAFFLVYSTLFHLFVGACFHVVSSKF